MNPPLEHEHAAGGSPLYQVSAEHLCRGIRARRAARRRVAAASQGRTTLFVPSLAPAEWLLAGLLAGSAAIHAGLAIGHDDHAAGLRALFLVDARCSA